MLFDPSAYLPVDAHGSLGASASGVAFATATGDILEVSSYGPGVFRLRAGAYSKPDYGIVQGRAQACTVAEQRPGVWTLTNGATTLEITEDPLRFRLLRQNVPAIESASEFLPDGSPRLPAIGRLRREQQWLAAVALAAGEPVYGLGEKTGTLDKHGQLVHSWSEVAPATVASLTGHNTPFAWGPGTGVGAKGGAWGLFVHTPGRVTHGIGYPDWSHRSYAVLVDDEALDLFLFAAATPAGVLDQYSRLTGRAPGVPLWSLGLWVSRHHYPNPDAAIAAAGKLRERRIPCDVLTLEQRSAWSTATRFDFRWDAQRFGHAAATLAEIKKLGLKVGVAECPYVSIDSALFGELAARGYLLSQSDGDPLVIEWDDGAEPGPANAAANVPPASGIVDFTNPGAFAWWRDAHASLFTDGIDLVQADGGEQVPEHAIAFNGDRGSRLHNVYPLLYSQCVYEATSKLHAASAAAPIVWRRAGWAASQRYPIAAAGASASDWGGLAASLRAALSCGMSGIPHYGADVGGTYGPPPTAELYVRWLQASVFGSHLRLTGPDEREPWVFGEEAEAIARTWLALRYRLLPYLQRVLAEASATGLPVRRAMPLAFPGSAFVRKYETQFMFGDALLVAPIVVPGGEVEIALPPGAWYDFNSRQRFPGLRVLRYRAALDQFPVFCREGHSLPLGPAVEHTGAIDPAQPLDGLLVFGQPTQPLAGLAQVSIAAGADGVFAVDAAAEITVEVFGEPPGLVVTRRDGTAG